MQDVLVMDIDRDQQEELVLLIWKHGSYGRHLPVWEKKNDIRLEQHIFIYRLQERNISTDVMRPVWMSSSLGTEIESIARGRKNSLILTRYRLRDPKTGGDLQNNGQELGLSLTFIPGKTVLLRIVQVPAGSGRTLDLNMQESQRSSRLRWSVQVII